MGDDGAVVDDGGRSGDAPSGGWGGHVDAAAVARADHKLANEGAIIATEDR